MKSLAQKIKQCEGLMGTDDITRWEQDFLQSVCDNVARNNGTTALSDKQVEIIDRIYEKNFA